VGWRATTRAPTLQPHTNTKTNSGMRVGHLV
jgi:hypothetical protein